MKARSADLIDVETDVLDFLMGNDASSMQGTEPSILVAEDLAPSETVKLDKSLLLGMITREGSSNSHTAILPFEPSFTDPVQGHRRQLGWKDGDPRWLQGCIHRPTDDPCNPFAKHAEDVKKLALLEGPRNPA